MPDNFHKLNQWRMVDKCHYYDTRVGPIACLKQADGSYHIMVFDQDHGFAPTWHKARTQALRIARELLTDALEKLP